MKLYLLSQQKNTGYDTYDSCVVAAENMEDAMFDKVVKCIDYALDKLKNI